MANASWLAKRASFKALVNRASWLALVWLNPNGNRPYLCWHDTIRRYYYAYFGHVLNCHRGQTYKRNNLSSLTPGWVRDTEAEMYHRGKGLVAWLKFHVKLIILIRGPLTFNYCLCVRPTVRPTDCKQQQCRCRCRKPRVFKVRLGCWFLTGLALCQHSWRLLAAHCFSPVVHSGINCIMSGRNAIALFLCSRYSSLTSVLCLLFVCSYGSD